MKRDEIIQRLNHVSPETEYAIELKSMLLFDEIEWDIIDAEHEIDGDTTLLGRKHQGEVVLERYLLPVIEKLNPRLPKKVYTEAIKKLVLDRSTMSIAKANLEVYKLLKYGIAITFRNKQGINKTERIKVVDWNNPTNNHFLLVSQLWVNGAHYRKRPDLVGFINGIPLVVMELKAPHVNVFNAYKDNFTDYKDTIPHLFWYNAIVILSNGGKTKVGSVTAEWGHFAEWKKINSEGEEGIISLETAIKATCEKGRLIDILENFTLFEETSGGLIKLVAKNHQYLGVGNAIDAIQKVKYNQGRLGVFWHTQGSGKSASMMFFSQKVLRKIPGNWTFIIVTDRKELDKQIYRKFQNSGVVTEEHVQAKNINNLRKLLKEDHRYIFSLIHKFSTEDGLPHPVLSERDDIIIITDEAHRSQYDILAQNMRNALPNACFLGFTGTPLIKGEEEKTREVFGDYVSIYNFKQSIDDGATVPLYYENRLPEVHLTEFGEQLYNKEMNTLLDEAMLDDDQEKKLDRELGRMYHVITRDDRLDKVAKNIVEHFMGRGHQGKAMYVGIDKATAIKMYDKVKLNWQNYIDDLKNQIPNTNGDDLILLKDRIEYMEETDMAVVVSSAQNEIQDMQKKGLDILPHRIRMNNEELDKKFKDADNPFRLVFVCAMWITGFDVPSCSTIYLDKPMQNHTLMQTIARANRVSKDKTNGLIVDYVGIFRNLEKALSIYGAGTGDTENVIKNKDDLKTQLILAIDDTKDFLEPLGFDLEIIRQEKDVFSRIALKDDAVNKILIDDDTKKEYLRKADLVTNIYRAYLPDPIETEVGETAYLIRKIAKQIRSYTEPITIDDIMGKVDALLDKTVAGFEVREPETGWKQYDLSAIDFDELRKKYEKSKKRIVIERLRNSIEAQLDRMIKINSTRMDYKQKLQEIINDYNHPSASLDDIFDRLVNFSKGLNEEEKRHVREGLDSEAELTVFDLLTKPDMKLNIKETKQVKSIARTLLAKLKTEKLVLDWRKKQQTRADVKLTIETILDTLPDMYTKDKYQDKCNALYQYIYDLADI